MKFVIACILRSIIVVRYSILSQNILNSLKLDSV